MVEFIQEEKKIVVKIVYYGPALSGKTTNLMKLHDILNPMGKGDLMILETKGDRTLYFDLLPLISKSNNGFTIKMKLFTVPGQVAHDATRKAVLSRADGVVFVADSQICQSMSNFESFENLENNVKRVGLDFNDLPLVIQFNKRDIEEIITEEEVLDRWHPTKLPIIFSTALYGEGVQKTFERVLKDTYRSLASLYKLKEKYGVKEEDFLAVIPGKEEACAKP